MIKKHVTDKKTKKPTNNLLDPDIRFLLANERTLLAWIRTGLAVLAGGFALVQLSGGSTVQSMIGTAALFLGSFMTVVGYIRFRASDKAIRQGKLPEAGIEPFIQTGGIVLIALALLITHLLGIW